MQFLEEDYFCGMRAAGLVLKRLHNYPTSSTIIAIKAFTNENRNYPASLNELVPRYLPSIPQDPFGDKALKYSMNKKIIYSVGRDMQDTGGSTGDDWRQMSDPTFEIDF